MKICAPDAETRRKSALAKAWINFHCQNFFCLFYPLKAWTRGKISLAAQVSQYSQCNGLINTPTNYLLYPVSSAISSLELLKCLVTLTLCCFCIAKENCIFWYSSVFPSPEVKKSKQTLTNTDLASTQHRLIAIEVFPYTRTFSRRI